VYLECKVNRVVEEYPNIASVRPVLASYLLHDVDLLAADFIT
jgi:hypothetical protein